MHNRNEKSPDAKNFKLVAMELLVCAVTLSGCTPDPPEEEKAPNKLPPPIAYSSADFVDDYEGYTVLVDSFKLDQKTEAYYLAGQLRAAQTRSFVIRRPNQKLFVCVGSNKTKRQAESISKYLNSRYELETAVLKLENELKPEQ